MKAVTGQLVSLKEDQQVKSDIFGKQIPPLVLLIMC